MGLFDRIVTSHPKVTDFIFTKSPSSMPRKKGQKKALAIFKRAAVEVPAYQDFLKSHHLDPATIETFDDFVNKVPLMDKNNYLNKYDLAKRCLGGTMADKYSVDRSSGYQGTPYFWPVYRGQRDTTPAYLEYLGYKFGWFAKDTPTLVIINLGLGLWVAGVLCVRGYGEIANKGHFPITVVAPGVDTEATVEVIKKLGPNYKKILMVAYPPLAKVVLEEGKRQGIDWKKYKVSLFVGGEGHSENWRDYIADLLGFKVKGAGLQRIISIFGGADFGGIGGYETPLAVKIRRLAQDDDALAKALFGHSDRLPQLFHYSPASNFIEEVNHELVFTTLSGCPVVRYNVHDVGGVILFEKAVKILQEAGYNIKQIMEQEGYPEKTHLPLDFNYVFGRNDGTITVYGANIFVENIKEALAHKDLGKSFSGAFKLETKYTKAQNQQWWLTLETAPGVKDSQLLHQKTLKIITESLACQNSEYRKLWETQGAKVAPHLIIKEKILQAGDKFKYI